jgi:hypothetical protein
MSTINQLRASDFVIFTGTHKDGEKKGKPFKFAKVDSRCNLMNNDKFIADLETEGAKVITCS